MKNRVLFAAIILVICIPLFIAVGSYVMGEKTPVSVDTAVAIDVADPEGNVYSYDQASAEITAFFKQIEEKAGSIPNLPSQLENSEYFKVSFNAGKKTSEYKYYITAKTNAAYYTNSEGKAFVIAPEDAEKFVTFDCAQCLYDDAHVPALTVSGLSVAPVSYTWNFTLSNNEKAASTLAKTAEPSVAYTLDGGIDFAFDKQPDSLEISIEDKDGKTVYSGAYSEMTDLDIKEEATFKITAAAVWNNTLLPYDGEVKYDFVATLSAPVSFALGDDKILLGEFVCITAYNAKDISKIAFECEPAISYNGSAVSPKFFTQGENAYALVPVPAEMTAGVYKMKLSYGALSQTLELTVDKKNFSTRTQTVDAATAGATYTDETLAAFDKLAQSIIDGAENTTKYFDGVWGYGVLGKKDNDVMAGFGHFRTVSSTKQTYRHTGVDFYADEGTSVTAVNKGKVIYTGAESYPGKFVVIEHGYGLFSWYANLSEYSVKVGDVVERDAVIGKSGRTGFTGGGSAHVGLSIFSVPVCPYLLWESSDDAGMVLIK